LTDSFSTAVGVHQGAPWSMELFMTMYDGLLSIVSSSRFNPKINSIKTGCVAFADDLAIVCIHKKLLQHQLDVAHEYANKWIWEFC